jgi:hypothetical protein
VSEGGFFFEGFLGGDLRCGVWEEGRGREGSRVERACAGGRGEGMKDRCTAMLWKEKLTYHANRFLVLRQRRRS